MPTSSHGNTVISAAYRPFGAARRGSVRPAGDWSTMAAMKRANRGMTLLELMMGITVLGVLVAIAVPSFRGFAAGSRNAAATNGLVTALNLARSEALRRSGVVRVCASADQASCSGDADGWASGWIVFSDTDMDGAASAGELLQAWPSIEGGITSTGTADIVSYNSMGMGMSALEVDIIPQHCSGNQVGRTAVSVSGSIQTSKVGCP